ncbi:alpha/beta hydrolase [Streptomyces sp. NPDC049879]|uniref:alpha/beta hydrolase n=1 Tax=Streptomyces sp. NPDC049879 TaxID=3365598 RepID=UPI0037BAFD7A
MNGTPWHPVVVPPDGHRPGGWLVWAHGGSWHTGSTAAWFPALADYAAEARTALVGVDYRLAPAHPYPAPLHDVLAAYDWTRAQADGAPVSLGGDSAGATLAATAALALRDRGDEQPAAQILAYPPLDPACTAPSYHRDPAAFPQPAILSAAWRAYGGDTPLHAADLTGLAPAVLAVGALDPVADDVTAYARRLTAAHVPTRLLTVPHTRHGAFRTAPAFRRHLAAAHTELLRSTR